MSRLLHLVNRIKAEARSDALTDGQRLAAAKIHRHWQLPERVNLVGPTGTGKTFLGWALARSYNASFRPSPQALLRTDVDPAVPLIVDNAPSDTLALRRVVAELQLRGVRSALLITRDENRLGLPIVRLGLPTTQDIHIVYHNLSLLEHYALSPLVTGNLWQVIYSTLR